jgi:TolA-binding protein
MRKKILILFLISIFGFYRTVLSEEIDEVKKNFNYAESLFDAELYQSALEVYLRIINFFPKTEFSELSEFKIGKCYQRLGKYWLAIKQFENFIKKYPESKFVQEAKNEIELTKSYIQNKDIYAISMEDFLCDEYINRGNEHINRSEKITSYGKLYIEEEFKTGIYWFEKAIAEFPNSPRVPRAYFDLATAYRRTDKKADYEKAIEIYQKIVDNYPDSVWADRALLAIGDTYKDNLQNTKKAIEIYKNVIDKYKDQQNNYFVKYAETQIKVLGGEVK